MRGFVSNIIIDQIRSASDIVEIIEVHVPLKKSGKNYTGLCPFHAEKTPSFSVSPEKQIYHCFGCGEGGNVFSFLMKFSSLSFPEALEQLGNRYGIPVSTQDQGSNVKSPHGTDAAKREKYFALNKQAAVFFHQNLLNENCGKAARDYLLSRNITSDIIKKFYIGYADKSWDSLLTCFRRKNASSVKDLEKTGLILLRESGTGHYDRFRDRIMFPIVAYNNKVCGFGGRDVSFKDKAPKYINSPESFVYNKSEILYGLNLSKESIRKKGYVVIVEGYFDLISLFQQGFENVVATCGTALTSKHARLIKRFTNNVILLFDGDEAGFKASTRGFEVLLEYGMNIKAVDLPENIDPDKFINEIGLEKFQEKINKATLFIEYITDKITKKINLNSLEERTNGLNTVLPFLAKIENSIERTGYLPKLAESFRASDKSLLEELRKALEKKKDRISTDNAVKFQKAASDWSERNIVRLIILHPGNIEKVKAKVNINFFSDSSLKNIVEFLFGLSIPKEQLSPQKIVELLPREEEKKIVTELLMEDIEFDDPEKALDDCIQAVRKKATQEEIENLKKRRIEAAGLMKVDEFKKLDKTLKALQDY